MNAAEHKRFQTCRLVLSIMLMTFALWCFLHTFFWVMPINILKYIVPGILFSVVASFIKPRKSAIAICAYVLTALLVVRSTLVLNTEVRMRYYGTLYDAIHTGDATIVQRRISDGCDVNETVGGNPIMCSVFQLYSYRSTYEPGPPKDVRDKRIAEIVKVLVDNGANVDATDQYRGWSALFWAITQSNMEAVKLLVANGADVNLPDKKGYTPLHFAQIAPIMQTLVDNGAEVNAVANDGNTPLHRAPTIEIAEILISHGAKINAKNKSGETPLDLSISNGYEDLVDFFRRRGAETTR